jgi:hypothetical protein
MTGNTYPAALRNLSAKELADEYAKVQRAWYEAQAAGERRKASIYGKAVQSCRAEYERRRTS